MIKNIHPIGGKLYYNFFFIQFFSSFLVQILTFNVRNIYIFNSMLVQIFGKEKLLKTFINVDDKILLSLVVSFVIILTSTTKTTHSIYFPAVNIKLFLVRRSIIILPFFLYFIWKDEGKIFQWSSVFSIYRIFFNIV